MAWNGLWDGPRRMVLRRTAQQARKTADAACVDTERLGAGEGDRINIPGVVEGNAVILEGPDVLAWLARMSAQQCQAEWCHDPCLPSLSFMGPRPSPATRFPFQASSLWFRCTRQMPKMRAQPGGSSGLDLAIQ